MEQEVIAETLGGEKIFAPANQDFADILGNANYLFSMHPAPWGFKSDSLVGYVVDANNQIIFGGENCEGRVDENDKEIVALVDVINSLWVYMKGEK